MPGSPIILVEYYKWEMPKLSSLIESVDSVHEHNINLYHTTIHRKDSNVVTRVWLIEKDSAYGKNDNDYVRRLRINLLRLHSEQESLKNVLTAIENNTIKINEEYSNDILQEYLNNTIRSISKDKRYGLPHADIVNLSNKFENIVNPRERENILKRVRNIRPNIYRKVESYTKIVDAGKSRYINIKNIYINTVNKTEVAITDSTIGDGNDIGSISKL